MFLETGELMRNTTVTDSIFLSDEQIKKIQKVNFQIAKDVLDYCEKNNLRIYLGGGTALGAVRHHGFIPWDDDIDLNMPRKDFECFVAHFLETYGEKYYYKANLPIKNFKEAPMLKIVKKNTVYKRPTDEQDEDTGVWIDIWIIENTFNNVVLRNLHGLGCYLIAALVSCKYYNLKWEQVKDFYKNNQQLLKLLKIKNLLGYSLFFISLQQLYSLQGTWFRLCKNNFSKYVSIPMGRKKFFGELHLRYPFLNVVQIDFEGLQVPITEAHDEYLNSLYGANYMQVPPLEKREKHAVLEVKF